MEAYYTHNINELESRLRKIKQSISYLYVIRLLTFLLFIAFVILAFQLNQKVLFSILAVLNLIGFMSAVKIDLKLVAKEKFFANKLKINRDELNFLNYKYAEREPGEQYKTLDPNLTADFDIFGNGSLFQYLNRCSTKIGEHKLATRLCEFNHDSNLILAKQQAIKELSEQIEFIQNFQTHGTLITENGDEQERLNKWIEDKSFNINTLRTLCVVFPAINLAWLIAVIIGVLPGTSIILPILVTLAVSLSKLKQANITHSKLSKISTTFEKYSILIKLIEDHKFTSPFTLQQQKSLSENNQQAGKALKSLFKLLNTFDLRLNVIAFFALNSTILFDFQVLYRLEKWKSKYGSGVKLWLDALSEIDVLISYATYAANNTESIVYPTIHATDFDAEQLGHPLISRVSRVTNDVKFGNSPSVIIVTGANMAGKSTFLRTIAVNQILAMNGSPVCAKKMSFYTCNIMSSIKIQDSLTDNQSYFYAELLRIKEIIEYVKDHPKTLVILDEILRGTNTKDKQLGSLGLLEKLISLKAVVIVATHDLVIGELESQYPQVVTNKCFEVELTDDQLIFDYKLKNGISKKLNASFLMKKMDIIS